MAMDYNVTIDVKVNSTQLDNLKAEINSLKTTPITLNIKKPNIDTGGIRREITRALNNTGHGMKPIKPKVDASGAKKEITNVVNGMKPYKPKVDTSEIRKEITSSLNTAGHGMKPIKPKVDTSEVRREIKGALNTTGYGMKPIKIKADASEVEKTFQRLLNLQNKINNKSKNMGNLKGADLTEARAEIQGLMAQYNKLYATVAKKLDNSQIEKLNKAASSGIPAVKQATNAWNELVRVTKEVGSISTRLTKLGGNANSNQIKELEAQLKSAKAAHDSLRASLSGQLSTAQYQKLNSELERTERKIRETQAALADTKANKAKNISNKFVGESYEKSFAKTEASMNQLEKIGHRTKGSFNGLKDAYNALGDVQKAYRENQSDIKNQERLIAAQERFNSALTKTNNLVSANKSYEKTSKAQQKAVNAASDLKNQRNLFLNDVEIWSKNNSAALPQFGKQIDDIKSRIRSCDAAGLKNLRTEFKNVTQQAQLADKATLSFTDRLKMQARRYAAYFGVASAMMGVTRGIRSMFDNTLKVDTAMTELYRVTDLTSSDYSNLYDKMSESAQKYGTVLSDLIGETADWSRAGFDANTATSLAEITTIYQHIADLDYSEASENLLTAYKGFESQLKEKFGEDSASAVSHIGDVLNELDNNYAVTAAGIGEGIQRSASALSVAGNTLEETAAMIGGIEEVTQDPEKAGNALKVVSMRIRGMKGELEELGEETDENVESISKMQTQILNRTGGSVDIFNQDGEFKSTYDIMQGIAEVWNDISDTDQAELLEIVAGKHRANDVAALLSNWENVEKMKESAMNSDGSAATEYAKYLESLQAHIDKLKASWQNLSATTMKTGFLNGLIDGLTSFINLVDKLVDNFGVLPTLATAFAAALSFRNTGFATINKDVTGAMNQIQIFGRSLNNIVNSLSVFKDSVNSKGLMGTLNSNGFNKVLDKNFLDKMSAFQKGLQNDERCLRSFFSAMSGGTGYGQAFETTMKNASSGAQEFVRKLDTSNIDWKNFDPSKNTHISEFTSQQKMLNVATMAHDKSLSNVSSLIKEYNNDCKKTGLTQKTFASCVGQTNSVLGTYLSGLNGAQAKFTGYIGALAKAKLATFALEAATMAMNMALTMGIALLIQGAITGIMSWINRASELSDKVDDVTQAFENQKKELKEAKSIMDEVNPSNGAMSRYEQLAKGVDALGRNVSLTADEYSEYLDITGQIAETFPSLIKGYDSQGNAILSCKSNVEQLTEAYNEMAKAANNEVISNANDIFEDFGNKKKELNGEGIFNQDVFNAENKRALEDILNSTDIEETVNNLDDAQLGDIAKELTDKGLEIDGVTTADARKKFIIDAVRENNDIVKSVVSDFDSKMQSAVQDMQSLAEAYLGNKLLSDDFKDISEETKDVINSLVPNMDYDYFDKFESVDDMYDNVGSLAYKLKSMDENGDKTFETYFELKAKVDDGDCTVGEYVNSLSNIEAAFDSAGFDDAQKKVVKATLGLDEDGIEDKYDRLVEKLSGQVDKKVAEKFAGSLSSKQLDVALDLIASGEINVDKISSKNLDDFMTQIEHEANLIEAMDFSINIETETSGIEKLNTALSESVSAAGLTSESIDVLSSRYQSLDGYDPSTLFENTTNGIKANKEELNRLESEYEKFNNQETEKNLNTLVKEYNDLTKQIDNANSVSERASLIAQRDNTKDKIEDLAEMRAQYEGLTSAYNKWLSAQEGTDSREGYSGVATARKDIKEEMSQGWFDEGTKRYIDLLSFDDLSNATYDEYMKAWKGLSKKIGNSGYSINDFFTVDDDDNATTKGIFNFFRAVESEFGKTFAKQDKKGNWFVDLTDGKLDKVAEKFGMDVEAITLLLQAYEDAGGTVNWDGLTDGIDLAVGDYDKFIQKAEEANDVLNKLNKNSKGKKGTDYEFDFNTTDATKLDQQLSVAADTYNQFLNKDGTLNLELKGAKEAKTVLDTLISQKLLAEQPAYMYVDASQVESELQRPLQMLQEYQDKKNIVTELETKQKYGIQIDESELNSAKKEAESALNDVANYISGLDEKTKIQFGFEVDDSADEIKEKVSSGKVTVPTELELTANTNDLLEQIVDELRVARGEKPIYEVDIEAKAGEVDTSDVDKKTDEAVKESVEGDKKTETKVDTKVKSGDIDTSDVKQKTDKAVKESVEDNKKTETKADTKVKSGEVDTSDVKQKTDEAIKKSVEDNKKTETKVDTEVKSGEVDTSDVKKKTDEAVKKSVEDGKKTKTELDASVSVDTSNIENEIDKAVGNIEKLADAIKTLNDVDDNIVKNVTANVEGNVIEQSGEKIDTLKVFSDGAKNLNDVKSFSSNVTANVYGNVTEESEDKLDNLKVFYDSAKDLKNVGSFSSNVTASVEGNVTEELEYKIDNLKVFSDSAKDLKNVGSFASSVVANIEGNVKDTSEDQIDNLKVFYDSAKDLEKVGSFASTVVANVEGNVTEEPEYKIDNLKVFSDSAKDIKNVGIVRSGVTANIEGNVKDTSEDQIDNLKVFTDSAKDIKTVGADTKAKITADIEGNVKNTFENQIDNLKAFTDSAKDIHSIGPDTKAKITADIEGNVKDTSEDKLDNLKSFTDNAKDVINVGPDTKAKITADIEGNVKDTSEDQIDNLKVFTDNAKEIDSIGSDTKAKITADIEGNVKNTFEDQIDNLKAFTDNAKDISNIGPDTEAKITADIEGNVKDTSEDRLDNLKSFIDNAKGIDSVGEDITAKITADIEGNVKNTFESQIDNLKAFTESAKDIDSIGEDTKAKITADIEGNVKNTFEGQIDNLKAFTDNAKDIKGVGEDTKAKITADIEGNVKDTFEYQIDNLKTFTDSAKDIKSVGEDTKAKITADIEGNVKDTFEYQIDNLKTFVDSAKDIDSIGPDTKATVTANIEGNVKDTFEAQIDNLRTFIDSAKGIKEVGEDTNAVVTATLNSNGIGFLDGAEVGNLKTFAEGAKQLKDVGEVNANVTATLNAGGIGYWDNTEVDNLKAFAEGAKKLQDVSDVDVTVTATLDSDSINGETANNLKAFAEGVNGIKGIGEKVSVTAEATLTGNGLDSDVINKLKPFGDGAKALKNVGEVNADVTATLDASGIGFGNGTEVNNLKAFGEGAKELKGIETVKANVTATLTSSGIDGTSVVYLQEFADTADQLQNINSKDITMTANINGELTTDKIDRLSEFSNVASSLSGMSSVKVTATASVNADAINSAKNTLQSLSDSGVMHDYESNVTVNAHINSGEVDSYKPQQKTAIAKYNLDKSAVDKWTPKNKNGTVTYKPKVEALTDSQKNKTGTITYKAKIEGAGKANGTAHVNGSARASGTAFAGGTTGRAFKQGNWGTKDSGVALGGELGQELVVRGGRFFTIGDNGAEFFKYKKNDIIK